ncbi:isochorismatase family protein [Actinokineospora cianjurensis]|uniref:Isochorismate hydrolase n=1 Tax=Actinokineospora cianjurensis TaxID=585224 RepID=A0A421AWE3_9PSEU|nr:isochorismatase family protein [Actinokineospora cianjurensis]RLK54002.1 isochorismate hydrolase [Actinokineospora cianjurensis]
MTGIPPIEPYPLPTAADLPANTAAWTVDPARAVLLVHDMQRYFVRPFATGTRERIVGNIAALRSHLAERGARTAYTAQPGGMTEQDRGLLRDFWGPGMRVDPSDREVVDELAPGVDDWVFTKWRYSAFFRSDLLARMRADGRDQIVLCGVYAHVGVLATAIEAYTNDIHTFLVADALGDFSERYHRMAVDYAAERCAVVATTDVLLDQVLATERVAL